MSKAEDVSVRVLAEVAFAAAQSETMQPLTVEATEAPQREASVVTLYFVKQSDY